jgi:hypothetical protein
MGSTSLGVQWEERIRLCGSSLAVGERRLWRCGASGGEKEMPINDEWRLWGGTLEEATRLSVELRSDQVHPEPLWFAHPDLRL